MQKSRIKIYDVLPISFRPLSGRLTMLYAWFMLLNLIQKLMNDILLGQLWNKPCLMPGLWLWMHCHLLMSFAKNRPSKLLFHLPITNHLKKRKFSVRNYTIPLKGRTKQTNYLMMLHGNEKEHHKIAIKGIIPHIRLIPTSTFDFHHETPTTEAGAEEIIITITTEINDRIRETTIEPADHPATAGKNNYTSYTFTDWYPPFCLQETMAANFWRFLDHKHHFPPYKKLKVRNLYKKYFVQILYNSVTENVPDYERFRTCTISGSTIFVQILYNTQFLDYTIFVQILYNICLYNSSQIYDEVLGEFMMEF